MRRYLVTMYVISGMLLLGCSPSIHPLFTSEDLVFDPALVGTWATKKGAETLQFMQADEKSYRVVYHLPGKCRFPS